MPEDRQDASFPILSVMFNFTPLLGAQSESPASQSLLELDGGVKILIDVGWRHDFAIEQLKPLERYLTFPFSFLPLTKLLFEDTQAKQGNHRSHSCITEKYRRCPSSS